MQLFLGLGIIIYLIGYHWDPVRPGVAPIRYLGTIIKPPEFVYWLCWSPRSVHYPKGVMLTGAVCNQFLGIALVLFAFLLYGNPEIGIQIAGFLFLMIPAYAIPYWLSRRYPYSE